jgi:integrase
VDLDAGVAVVRHQLQRVDTGEVDGAGRRVRKWLLRPIKSRAGRRAVALPELARQALIQQRDRQTFERTTAGPDWGKARGPSGEPVDPWLEAPPRGGLVFTTVNGTPLDRSNVTHRYQARLVSLGIERRPFHALRHTNASLLIEQGVHPKDLQGHLGHAEYGTTMNVYGHRFAGAEPKVATLVDQALSRPARAGQP